jgi:hypothetical protein
MGTGMKQGLLIGAAIFLSLCGTAQAEVGRASANPGEWFLGFTAGGGSLWGTEHEAYMKGTTSDSKPVNFDKGDFISGGAEIGYRLEDPAGLIDRVELNLDLGRLSRNIDRDSTSAFFALMEDNDNRDAFGVFNFFDPQLRVDGEEETTQIETRLSIKSTLLDNEDHALIVSVEPFFRYQNTNSLTEVTRSSDPDRNYGRRRDDIDAEYYGLQVALEMEKPLSEQLSLVGRASAGGYYVTSDIGSTARFLSNSATTISADGDEWGGRFGGALGIKVPLFYKGASLTLLGTVDYMTDVATIDHIPMFTRPPTEPTKAAFDDQIELGGKVGLVFPLR